MNIYENQRLFYEGTYYDIAKERAVGSCLANFKELYGKFLKEKEQERILFKVDFVDGRYPLAILINAFATSFEVDYDELEIEFNGILEPNKLRRDEKRIEGDNHIMRKIPELLTERISDFCGEFPGAELDVEKRFELLQGKENPLHGLVIERYIDSTQLYSKFPLAEIWTVKRLREFVPTNSNRAVIPYNAIPEARVRRVSGGGPSGFRGR